MIELTHASRWYGLVIGLNDVTASIGPGITALIGQNGAGKSTMMKLITGQIRPTTGTVRIAGMEPFANPDVFRLLGYCPDLDNFYEQMTGRQFVTHMARLSGYGPRDAAERGERSLTTVRMIDRCDKAIAGYSKGMRQRIKLAQAILHDPQVILLDEPLNGLDPVGRHEFMGVLSELSAQGKTVIISSHILYEVEQLTQSIMLLHRGRLLATGDLRTIRGLIDKYPQQIRIETPEPHRVARHLVAQESVLSVTFEREGLLLRVREVDAFFRSLAEVTLSEDLPILALESPDNNLEAVFRYLVEA